MTTSVQSYSGEKSRSASLLSAALSRLPLVMVSIVFVLISLRYLIDPVRAAAAAGMAFTSPGGITMARVGFAAFPLSFAVLAVSCLVSTRRVRTGLYIVLTVVLVVIAVRVVGIMLDHSASESARLLAPEAVLVALSVLGIRLDANRRRREKALASATKRGKSDETTQD